MKCFPRALELSRSNNRILHSKEGQYDDSKPYHESTSPHNKHFSKDSAVITPSLLSINRVLEKRFVTARTNVKFSDNVYKFAVLVPSTGQQQYEDFVYSHLV